MTNICYIWFVLSHSLPEGGISCAVSGIYLNMVVFKLCTFVCLCIRRDETSAPCSTGRKQCTYEKRLVWESRIVVEKLCLLLSKLKLLLCLKSENVDHDLYSGRVGHKILCILNVRNETCHSMLG